MKRVLSLLVLFCCLPSLAADKANADALNRWVGGKWPLEGKMLDTDYSKALTVTGVSTCGWSPDHVFMICDQSLLEEGKPSRELSVYAYDPEKETFHFYGMSPTGGRPHSTDLGISPDGIIGCIRVRMRLAARPSNSAPSTSFATPTTSNGGLSIQPMAAPIGSKWVAARRSGRGNRVLAQHSTKCAWAFSRDAMKRTRKVALVGKA